MSKDLFLPGRSCAISLTRVAGTNLKHVSRDTGVRFYRSSPETGNLQIRLDSEKSHAYATAGLDIYEMRQLRDALTSVIRELEALK